MSKRFFDFFPPPLFLQMPSVGFSISDTSLRFVSLREHAGGYVLRDYAERPLPAGAVDAGYVHTPEPIIDALKDLKKTYNITFVKATLPEEKAFVFRTHIPIVAPEEMRSSVEFTIEENVPMQLAQVVFDYMIIPSKEPEPTHIDVVVSVVPTKVVETYSALYKEAGLSIMSFELESQAIARAIIDKHDTEPYLILHLERNKTGFYITTGTAVQFTSTMVITAENLAGLCEEIGKIYWHAHGEKKSGTRVRKILLCGEGAAKEGVAEYISGNLGIETEVANVWKNVFVLDAYVPDLPQTQSLSFPAAIGLALPTTDTIKHHD